MRRVEPFASQQRAELAGLRERGGHFENLPLTGGGERAAGAGWRTPVS